MEHEFEHEKPELKETVDVLVHVVDRLELGIQDLREEMRTGFKSLSSELGVVKSDVSTLKFDVHELKSDVSVLKSDVAVLKSDVSVLKSDVSEIKTDMRRLEGKMDDIADTLTETVEDHERRLVVLEASA